MPLNEIPKNQSIARTCAAINRIRLSRATTRHAIERSRKSLHETQALLVVLRNIYAGDVRRLTPTTAEHFRMKGKALALSECSEGLVKEDVSCPNS